MAPLPAGNSKNFRNRPGATAEIVNLALLARVEVRDVRIAEPSLENLFLHHTGRSLRD